MGRPRGMTSQGVGDTLARLARFLVVSDPGQLRLRSASQTTSTLVVALACLVVTTKALGQPITVAMLGSVVAMFSAFVVRDRSAAGRLLTTGLIVVPASVAVTVSTLLGPIRVAADVGFIVVLFTAVYVRRFGPRGFALGMGAFISYFFALFLRAQTAQLPYLLMAVVIGVAAALTVRFLFQREWAGAELTRLTRALRASALDVVDTVDPLGAEGYTPPIPGRHEAGARRTVAERLERLANTALMIEDWLDRNVAAAHVSVTGNDLSRRIFDAQQATEQVAFAMRGADPTTLSDPVRRAFAALRVVLHTTPSDDELRSARRVVTKAEAAATGSDQESIVIRSVARAVRAHTAVHRVAAHAIEREAAGERSSAPDAPTPTEASDDEASPSEQKGWYARLQPTTRTAIQVAVATSIATVLGEMVSPARWYWAVLSAFVVFTGTTTRGEILTRAGHRIVGTVVGVIAGVLLAALVGHDPPVQLALIVVCVFFAFYLVAVANGLLVFFITVLLAMLYGLLGTFSIAVLELRIVETCVGASVGITAAYFILPTRTRETVREKVDDYLEALDDLIVQCVDSVVEPGREVDLVPAARRLDLALQALQTAARPLQVGASDRRSLRVAPASRARRSTARLVRVLEACDRAAHALTRAGIVAAAADPSSAPSEDVREALRSGRDDVRASVAALRSVVREAGGDSEGYEGTRAHAMEQTPVTALVERDPEHLPTATRIAVRALDRLDHAAALTRVRI
ncbi:FUSC family protein [Williamsia serinedens]|uniref:Membrane protein YccC n=1 Tax=Williamsia serinedens TaxID=391736 RepID=A0ABT1H0H5_9NOCA|nr:FUSC family protein [Williamsia serinedens]MCP2160745.1 putative membrane protein YccC [Williamsia serinedens]